MTHSAIALPMRLAKLFRRAADRVGPAAARAHERRDILPAVSIGAGDGEIPVAPSRARFFDAIASQYDEAANKDWPIKRYISQEISALGKAFRSALVVGVGTGQELEPLLVSGVSEVEAIDFSENMLRLARGKYPTVTYHCADFFTFAGLHKVVYDLILCNGVFEYTDQFSTFLGRASRLLAPGGVLLLTFTPLSPARSSQSNQILRHSYYPEFHSYGPRREEIDRYVQSYGLSIRRCFTFDCRVDAEPITTCAFCVVEKPGLCP